MTERRKQKSGSYRSSYIKEKAAKIIILASGLSGLEEASHEEREVGMHSEDTLDEGTSQGVDRLRKPTFINNRDEPFLLKKTQGEMVSIISIVARDARGYDFSFDLQILKSELGYAGEGSLSKLPILHENRNNKHPCHSLGK